MSGEIVLVPSAAIVGAVGSVAVAGITVGLGASAVVLAGAASLVKNIVDARVAAAQKKIEAEKNRIRQWQAFQREQNRQMASLKKIEDSIAQSESRLAAIRLTEGNKDRNGAGPTAKGYSSLNRSDQSTRAARAQLCELSKILEAIPESFSRAESSPYKRLIKQSERLNRELESNSPPALEEIDSFKEMILRTIKTYTKELELKRKSTDQLKQKAGILFNEIMIYSQLAVENTHSSELKNIKIRLLDVVNSESFPLGQLEHIEKILTKIKTEIDIQMIQSAVGETVAGSITANLEDMGYTTRQHFSKKKGSGLMRALLQIPGGELLHIAIHPNNQLAFQVTHESRDGETMLEEEDRRSFRRQEQQWCNDFHELIRRLTAEGFSYSMGLERLHPDDSIPTEQFESTARFESAAEIKSAADNDSGEYREDLSRFRHEPKRREYDDRR
ncbi:MAG: hypothetical protein GY757_18125 [bacterium]|nr:hypothetical protein [bacterium]